MPHYRSKSRETCPGFNLSHENGWIYIQPNFKYLSKLTDDHFDSLERSLQLQPPEDVEHIKMHFQYIKPFVHGCEFDDICQNLPKICILKMTQLIHFKDCQKNACKCSMSLNECPNTHTFLHMQDGDDDIFAECSKLVEQTGPHTLYEVFQRSMGSIYRRDGKAHMGIVEMMMALLELHEIFILDRKVVSLESLQ